MNEALSVKELTAIIDRFSRVTIPVVGDLMLDRFIWGSVDRISPEAPVPVVKVTEESEHLGGALNVVNNIQSLGAKGLPIGLVGQDKSGELLGQILETIEVSKTGLIYDDQFQTIEKTRIIAQHQQVVRVDRESDQAPLGVSDRVLSKVSELMQDTQSLIVSDYGKGVVNETLLKNLRSSFRDVKISIDPKDVNFDYYKSYHIITPNQREASGMAGFPIRNHNDAIRAATVIFENLSPRYLLMTRGEHGMILFSSKGEWVNIPTRAREVFDVSGAGDTVIATYTLAESAGATPLQAAYLANAAAGVVVGKLGTATLSADELKQALVDHPFSIGESGSIFPLA